MRDFAQLEVWRKAKSFVVEVYRETARFPATEQYGLCGQLRRASVSIASNIAEGSGRGGEQDFARFLEMAMGSAAETRSHLLLAEELGYLKPEISETLSDKSIEIGRMLNGLIETLRSKKRR
jgi:four helix bundle protein